MSEFVSHLDDRQKAERLTFLTVLDRDGAAHSSFGTFRPPETYLIDKQGIIRRKFIGAQNWTSPEIVDSLRKLAKA